MLNYILSSLDFFDRYPKLVLFLGALFSGMIALACFLYLTRQMLLGLSQMDGGELFLVYMVGAGLPASLSALLALAYSRA